MAAVFAAGMVLLASTDISPAADKPKKPEAVPGQDRALKPLFEGNFHWNVSPPLVEPVERPEDKCLSMKDPTVVFHEGKWHLFCTIRSAKRSHQIEYLSFKDWPEANSAQRHVLRLNDGYFCAPQVFYFTPHKKWYMILQVIEQARKPALQPAFSTTTDVADPGSWSKPALLYSVQPGTVSAWIDFWVICDSSKAHLFFTSNNGLMWRAQTALADFPHGWTQPSVVLRGDVFEASHTYRLKGQERFLTVIEAQADGRRYYKAYLADRLDGQWNTLAATREKPFASTLNARHEADSWTDSISHGELLRTGADEHLEVDPANLRFLFQGVKDADRIGRKYGDIPWKLGILEPVKE